MKTNIVLFSLFVISTQLISQTHKIEWFEKQTVGSEIYKMSRIIEDPSHYYMAVRPWAKFTDRLLKVNHQGIIEINEPLLKDANGNDIRLYGLTGKEGNVFGYYRVTDGSKATIFRDQINTSTLKFTGQPQEVISGSVNPIDMIKPIWEKPERMELGYFAGAILADNYAYLDFPLRNMHAILKRETYKGKEQVDLKSVVLDADMKVLNKGRFQLSSTNTNTSLMHVLLDERGGLYLITGDYIEKNPTCFLYYLAPGSKEPQAFKIPTSNFVQEINGVIMEDGILMVGLKGEDHKKEEYSLFTTKFSFDTKAFSAEKSLSKVVYDKHDRFYVVGNGGKAGVFIQKFADSYLKSDGKLSVRIAGDLHTYMLDTDGQEIWYKNIKNYIVTGGGGILSDSYFPFVYNGRFYLIQNTHPENPGLAAKGEKVKMTTIGKDRFGTELIAYDENGELTRDFIYLREDKFVTIPVLTHYIGNGHFLLYADNAALGNSFMLGLLDLSN